jgi:hypothetical protein
MGPRQINGRWIERNRLTLNVALDNSLRCPKTQQHQTTQRSTGRGNNEHWIERTCSGELVFIPVADRGYWILEQISPVGQFKYPRLGLNIPVLSFWQPAAIFKYPWLVRRIADRDIGISTGCRDPCRNGGSIDPLGGLIGAP